MPKTLKKIAVVGPTPTIHCPVGQLQTVSRLWVTPLARISKKATASRPYRGCGIRSKDTSGFCRGCRGQGCRRTRRRSPSHRSRARRASMEGAQAASGSAGDRSASPGAGGVARRGTTRKAGRGRPVELKCRRRDLGRGACCAGRAVHSRKRGCPAPRVDKVFGIPNGRRLLPAAPTGR